MRSDLRRTEALVIRTEHDDDALVITVTTEDGRGVAKARIPACRILDFMSGDDFKAFDAWVAEPPACQCCVNNECECIGGES